MIDWRIRQQVAVLPIHHDKTDADEGRAWLRHQAFPVLLFMRD